MHRNVVCVWIGGCALGFLLWYIRRDADTFRVEYGWDASPRALASENIPLQEVKKLGFPAGPTASQENLPDSEHDESGLPPRENDLSVGERTAIRVRSIVIGTGDMSLEQRGMLVEFLRQHRLPEDVSQAQWIELKNEAWNRLRNDLGSHALFEGVALSVFENADQPEVLRNYALQHLGAWLLDGYASERVLHRMWRALEEVQSSIAGTALIGLASAGAESRGVSAEWLSSAALDLARNREASEASLIAALQVLGEWKNARGMAMAAEVAADRARSVPVRLAALAAAAGAFGAKGWDSRIQSLETEQDDRLKNAARRLYARWMGHKAER
jgi:hypothetical protein